MPSLGLMFTVVRRGCMGRWTSTIIGADHKVGLLVSFTLYNIVPSSSCCWLMSCECGGTHKVIYSGGYDRCESTDTLFGILLSEHLANVGVTNISVQRGNPVGPSFEGFKVVLNDVSYGVDILSVANELVCRVSPLSE